MIAYFILNLGFTLGRISAYAECDKGIRALIEKIKEWEKSQMGSKND